MNINPTNQIDFYKSGHIYQYPEKTNMVFSNFTPRGSRIKGVDSMVFFGLQYFIKEYLMKQWDEEFFQKSRKEVLASYQRRMDNALGKDVVGTKHLEALHDLGYLPICIRSVDEGTKVPMRVPALVIYNTKSEFFWLTNYLETILSCVLWGMCNSATIAHEYRKILEIYANKTVGNVDFVDFQAHDFSFRGMFGFEAACMSGAAHLTSFKGTDTVPAIDFLEKYYNANSDVELVGCSVPATEHSVMCLGAKDAEIETFRSLILDKYPKGIISIVSDTWDFWKVVTEYLKILKEDILNRDGKVVIRPDSGDPVKIICGDKEAKGYDNIPAYRGAVHCLWDIFGGTITEKGYKQLDSHIGLIYGDSITMERCKAICEGLEANGFASTNVVFGIGSYTYQYQTRDVFGSAIKATYAEIDNKPQSIYKKPKTDDGLKNSACGLVSVFKKEGILFLKENSSWDDVDNSLLKVRFLNGDMVNITSLQNVRDLINI